MPWLMALITSSTGKEVVSRYEEHGESKIFIYENPTSIRTIRVVPCDEP